jgi:hypothetical protein
MIVALERLLKEVDRRKLTAFDDALDKYGALPLNTGGAAPAAESTGSSLSLDPQSDKPPESMFNPLNWLGTCKQ